MRVRKPPHFKLGSDQVGMLYARRQLQHVNSDQRERERGAKLPVATEAVHIAAATADVKMRASDGRSA